MQLHDRVNFVSLCRECGPSKTFRASSAGQGEAGRDGNRERLARTGAADDDEEAGDDEDVLENDELTDDVVGR